MVAGLLNTLGSDADLVAQILSAVLERLAFIVGLTDSVEVALDHIQVVVIVLLVHSWVLELQDAKLVERVGDLLALFFPAFLFVEVLGYLDDGNFVGLHLNL